MPRRCAAVPVHGDGGCWANCLRYTLDQRPPVQSQRQVAPYHSRGTNLWAADSFIVVEAAGYTEEQAIRGSARHRHTEPSCHVMITTHPIVGYCRCEVMLLPSNELSLASVPRRCSASTNLVARCESSKIDNDVSKNVMYGSIMMIVLLMEVGIGL